MLSEYRLGSPSYSACVSLLYGRQNMLLHAQWLKQHEFIILLFPWASI